MINSIHDVIALIPEDTVDEALFAIETVIVYPASDRARLYVWPTHPFWVWLSLENGKISIEAENWPSSTCAPDNLRGVLRRTVYAIDEAIEAGRYRQTPPREQIITDGPRIQQNMDIPIWDAQTQRYYDAEYLFNDRNERCGHTNP